mmetsp:Transcript_83154/g.238937  ORF Transcript_83154/g.238937 Transcript_83154/m.238937 type:complete len:299 (+) Transcript_83154:418-1314(+)
MGVSSCKTPRCCPYSDCGSKPVAGTPRCPLSTPSLAASQDRLVAAATWFVAANSCCAMSVMSCSTELRSSQSLNRSARMALSLPRSASMAVNMRPRSCSVCLCFSSNACCRACVSFFKAKISSNLLRSSSIPRWSRCKSSRSARTFESTSRRSSAAVAYGAGPRPMAEPPLAPASRNAPKSSSAWRASASTNAVSSCKCEILRWAAALCISTCRRCSRKVSSAERTSLSCCSKSRRRESWRSNSLRSSSTSLLRRFSSPPESKRDTTSKTAASCPRPGPLAPMPSSTSSIRPRPALLP